MRVVATAGHVDHGKSTLVFALTGTDPDRFAEEKARGLTIDLGFAFTTLATDVTVGFVDVPGHSRYTKNMIAGVGAVDIALLVVAADEGWMPQTEEHAGILDVLGVRHGLVALTKVDAVDTERCELARLSLEERLATTAFASWPIVEVDAVSGRGLDELRDVLARTVAAAPPPIDSGRPRLWIDRVFAGRGTGTVVTGTSTGGWFAVDQTVRVEPPGREARIRQIESAHVQTSSVPPGARVALNLAGVEHRALDRGNAVVLADQWATPRTVDVAIRTPATAPFPRRGEVHVHVGSGEHVARLRPVDPEAGFARLELPAGLPLAPGDRMVLRSSARRETIGGAEVLDVMPAHRLRDARVRLRGPLGPRVLDAQPWASARDLEHLAGVADGTAYAAELVGDGHAVRVANWVVAPPLLAALRSKAVVAVGAAGASGVELASLASSCGLDPSRLRAALAEEPALVLDREIVRRAAAGPIETGPEALELVAALAARPFDPPAPADLGASPLLVRALVRSGALVDLDGVVFAREALEAARARVGRAVVDRGSLTIAQVRDLLGTSRKFVVPLLRCLDAEGVTRRRGDLRVPGPRAGLSVSRSGPGGGVPPP
jgi:selenocysteine-specific elongation factor